MHKPDGATSAFHAFTRLGRFGVLMSKGKARAKNLVGGRVREARLKGRPAVRQEDSAGRAAAQGILLDRVQSPASKIRIII